MKSTELRVVPFHGDEIVTFEAEGARYVAMRRICENMGLEWARQASKLQESQEKFNCVHMPTVGADGKEREMLSMPVEKLALWLASINPNKIKDATVRAKVERYQAESAIVLHDYWTTGVAVRGDLDGIVTGFGPAAMKAVGGMMKGIVAKALAETVPAMVEAALSADPRRAVLDFVSVRQLLDEAKAAQKGRRGLNRRVGYALRDRAAQDKGDVAAKCPHTGVWLFRRSFARSFMVEAGAMLVKAHNDRVNGHGALRLVRPQPTQQL